MQLDWAYIIPGVVIGTMGWMLYWAGLPVIGAIVGAGTGGSLGYLLTGLVTAQWAFYILPVMGLALGAVVGFIAIRVFQLYVFFAAGAGVGGALGYQWIHHDAVWRLLGQPGEVGVFVIIGAAAVVGGMLCVWLRRFIVALVTSVLGVLILIQGVPERYQVLTMIVGLAVFLATQIGLVNRFVDQAAFDRQARRALRDRSPAVDAVD